MLGIYLEAQKESAEVICGVKKEYGVEYEKENQSTLIRQWWGVHQRSFPTVMPR